MKKLSGLSFLILIGALLLACQNPRLKSEVNRSTTRETSISGTSSSESEAAQVKTETYQYQANVDDLTQTMTEKITYQGDNFLQLDLLIEEPLDEETKSVLLDQNLAELKDEILAAVENQESLSQLKAIKGVTTSIDLRDDYTFVARVLIDMQTVNLDELSALDDLTENFADFKVLKPKDYIASLVSQGAVKID